MKTFIAYFNHYRGEELTGQNSKEYQANTKEEAHKSAERTILNTNQQFGHTGKTVKLCMLLDKI